MLQLISISRLSEQVLRAEISCRGEETGFSYRGFKEKSLFRLLEPGILAPCLLAAWDTWETSWPPLLHRLWVQAGTSLWLPGLTILVRLRITKWGFYIKWWSHCRKREHNAGLWQFKVVLKWTTYGHHVDFEWLLCGDHIEPTSAQKYQKKCCTSQEMLHYNVQVLGSQPQLV